MLNFLGMPVAASAHAAEIDQMMVMVHWLMFVLFIGWGAFFVYVLFRFRKSANPRAISQRAIAVCRLGATVVGTHFQET